jgi:CBS domain containing-hemolysin-like protein
MSVLLLIIFLLLFFNAIYVAAEFAVISLRADVLEQHARQGKSWARRYLATVTNTANQDWYIAVAQVGITLASLGLGMYGEHEVALRLEPYLGGAAAHSLAGLLALTLLTFLHIVIGEMIPKSLALLYPNQTARLVWWPMRLSSLALGPLCWVLNSIGNALLRMLRLPVSQEMALVYSPEELRLVFEESRDEGVLAADRQRILESIMQMGETPLWRVMVPRTEVVALDEDTGLADAAARARIDQYSRYPLFSGSIDNIQCVLHVRDLLTAMHCGGETPVRVSEIARKALFLPETLSAETALERMRAEHTHMAVVLEEAGGTAGIVTLEDLVEQLFGELRDEFDAEEWGPILTLEEGWRIRGNVMLSELSRATGLPLQHSAATAGGLLLTSLGRPPECGDTVQEQGLEFRVESVRNRGVEACFVRKVAVADSPDAQGPSSGARR